MSQKILLLADSASSHTEKWATALAKRGFTIGIFSLNKSNNTWYKNIPNIVILYEPKNDVNANLIANKLKYLLALPKLMQAIKAFQPNVLHSHYATSYGLLGNLTRFKPFIISAWGSDVFDFPKRSVFHKLLLEFNLNRADQILSTSYAMKEELKNYTTHNIEVIHFGVDTSVFYPENVKSDSEKNVINIGSIKAMEDKYGIRTIIEAIQLVKTNLPALDFKVFLVGAGDKLAYYKKWVKTLDLSDNIIFTGKIPFSRISYYHNLIDIFLNVSIVDESFGVSVIEAMSCQKPVIVTNAPGLSEIVNSDTGIIIEKGNAGKLASAITKLILSPETRTEIGRKARMRVLDHYDFKECIVQMANVYNFAVHKTKQLNLHYPAEA